MDSESKISLDGVSNGESGSIATEIHTYMNMEERGKLYCLEIIL